MEYPLKRFLEEYSIEKANRKSVTYCRELVRNNALIATELMQLFRLDVRWEQGKKDPHPLKKYSSKADGDTETKFQRDIYNLSESVLGGKDPVVARWIDLEVPVDYQYGQARRTCPDLVGYGKGQRTYIVDLKYARKTARGYSATDTPIVGAFKALYYSKCAIKNAEKLLKFGLFHANSRRSESDISGLYENPIAILAANKNYWDFWRNSLGRAEALSKLIAAIKEHSRIEFRAYECSRDPVPWTEVC